MSHKRSSRHGPMSNRWFWTILAVLVTGSAAWASEGDLAIPDLHVNVFFGNSVSAWWLLFCGAMVICGTLGISLYLRTQIHKLPAHRSMTNVAEIIYQTCKTYLIQQGKFLLALFAFIAVCISFYLWYSAGHAPPPKPGEPEPLGTFATI